MLDLVIKGGSVVTPWGTGNWDVAIQGEKIVAVSESESLTVEAARTLDATGKLVVPGGIEPHAHIAAPVAGVPGEETAPPEQVSRAALFGGTTTLLDFAIQRAGTSIEKALEERTSRWKGQSYADYAHHIMLLGDIPPDVILGQAREAVQQGHASFKVFTTNIRPPQNSGEQRLVGMGHLTELMTEVSNNGAMLMVHAEDDDIVQYMYRKVMDEGRGEWWNMHLVHTNLSEDLSFRRVLRAAEITNCPTYLVHVSAAEGVTALKEWRSRGAPVYGETLHNYATFTAENYREPDGMKYHTYPSLKSEADRDALWVGLLDGTLSTMATDEYCTNWALKIQGRTVLDVTGGHNGAETRMGVTYTEGVVKRGMPLDRFVQVTSSNAARIMGLYPRKGVIAPGSDADIVLIDPNINKRMTMADFHISDYSIWEGYEAKGWPVVTVMHGKVVVENGEFHGDLSDGHWIKRRVSGDVVSKPAV